MLTEKKQYKHVRACVHWTQPIHKIWKRITDDSNAGSIYPFYTLSLPAKMYWRYHASCGAFSMLVLNTTCLVDIVSVNFSYHPRVKDHQCHLKTKNINESTC